MKQKMKRFCRLLAVGALALLTLGGCKKEEEEQVRVAYFPNITHSQALIMKDQGTFEEKLGEQTKVKWLNFQAGTAEVEAIFAGEVDLGFIGPIPAISAYSKSQGDVVIISGACDGGAVLVTRADAEIESIKDLSGRKISVPSLGNTQHLNLLNLLKENDLETTDKGGTVTIQPVANSDVKTLMDSGELDAAIVPEPWGSILEESIGAKVLLDWKDVWRDGDYATSVVVTTKEFLEEHPDIVAKFIEANREAAAMIEEQPEEAKQIVNRQIEEATQKPFDLQILDRAFSRLHFTSEISYDSILEFAEIYKEQGFIKELPGKELFDVKILEEQE